MLPRRRCMRPSHSHPWLLSTAARRSTYPVRLVVAATLWVMRRQLGLEPVAIITTTTTIVLVPSTLLIPSSNSSTLMPKAIPIPTTHSSNSSSSPLHGTCPRCLHLGLGDTACVAHTLMPRLGVLSCVDQVEVEGQEVVGVCALPTQC